ncbi:transglycosylase domain-containing protein [Gephyromycinifex aptenodytis]|uniref:transglycosylase domain-containing protein n=1 Tax=Gephyromycinifex aptenodytis TaxID=2716227 RepID=UPI001444A540|nr:transglycosylase domain-containing protein [Gephyromycinifex aptenodytis]
MTSPLFWMWAILAGLLLATATFAVAYALVEVPDPNEAAQTQTSIIYYADGKTEIDRISALNREAVKLSQVPVHVRKAFIAAEDRTFYDNPGISPSGIARAVWAAVRGGQTQGGSTITQQYVKNYFLTQDQTLTRKGRELIISLKIEREQSKDQILENYLNTIYFGRGAHGIQAASRAYFGKDVSKLSLEEGALLTSVVRGPSLYDPGLGAKQKKNLQARMEYVYDGMLQQGWLTAAERKKTEFPKVITQKRRTASPGTSGYITQAVKNELVEKVGLTPEQVDIGGLRITTTIQKKDQNAAVEAVHKERPSGGRADNLRVGLVALKPGDGAILALYGGDNQLTAPYSAATQAQLQGGSTFKIFALVAALQQDISTHTTFDGSSPRYFEEFKGGGNDSGRVQNFGNHSYGWQDLRTATAKSTNTVFAELNLKVGPQATMDAAVALGVPASTAGLAPNAANVFGTASPRVIDMANAYATLAAGGIRAEPYLIRSVTSVDGRFSGYVGTASTTRVISPEVAADAVDAMQQVVKRGTAQRASRLGRPVAGKTGTTDENRAVWFDGFTPEVATAVAMYLPDEEGNAQPMRGIGGFGEVTGGSYPVDIWTRFMRNITDGTPETDFPSRAGIGDEKAQPPEPTYEEQPQEEPEWVPQPQEQPTSEEPSPEWSPTDIPQDPAQPEGETPEGGDIPEEAPPAEPAPQDEQAPQEDSETQAAANQRAGQAAKAAPTPAAGNRTTSSAP